MVATQLIRGVSSSALQLLDLDRLDEALTVARHGRNAAKDAGESLAIADYQLAIGAALDARGDVDAAVAEYGAGIELAEQLGTGGQLSAYGALASIAIRRDDLDAAATLVDQGHAHLCLTGDQPDRPLFLRARIELHEARGQQAEAMTALTGWWHHLLDADVVGAVPLFAPDVVRLAVAEGDRAVAGAMAEAARDAADRLGTSTAVAAALRCHGTMRGNLDAFLSAVGVAAECPRPLARAGAHEDAGRALVAAGRSADAGYHLRAALDGYEQLGAVRDVRRVSAVARAVGIHRGQRGDRQRATHGWDSLTRTERRVADLVASGLSNPAIAERMFLSRRTVQTHVSHILSKTGLTSRVGLATAIASRRQD